MERQLRRSTQARELLGAGDAGKRVATVMQIRRGRAVLCDVGGAREWFIPVECADCGSSLPGARSDDPVERGRPCPTCGSLARLVRVYATEEMHAHERVDLRVKEGGRGKPVLELRQGDDQHRGSGVWHAIRRVIDRRGDRYEERVVRPDGVIFRDISVPLDEHRGHRSDTSRPKSHLD